MITTLSKGSTFGEETGAPILQMSPQEPAIAKVIVAFNELDAVSSSKTQFVRTARLELVWRLDMSMGGLQMPTEARTGRRR
jgi:hypothetical protein